MELILLGLLGAATMGYAFDSFHNDASIQDPLTDDGSDTSDENNAGTDLAFDGSDTLDGTDGDDTLSAGPDNTAYPDTINLNGGDDTADVTYDGELTINGGHGDDQITVNGVVNTVNGDTGNDILIGDDSNKLYGGEGDDDIRVTHGSFDQGESAVASGGEGDDTIRVRTPMLTPDFTNADLGGVDVTGGDGQDDIQIVYELNEESVDNDNLVTGTGPDDTFENKFIRVQDFDPDQDMLTVEIEKGGKFSDTDATIELVQEPSRDGYMSLVTMTLPAEVFPNGATAILQVHSTKPFGLDSIRFASTTRTT